MAEPTTEELIKEFFPFGEFRPGQMDNILQIAEALTTSEKENYIFEAPTGTGKSVIAYTAGKVIDRKMETIRHTRGNLAITSPRIIICTSTKQLQNQYIKTFQPFGAEYLWSARNYECTYYPPEDGVYYGSGACLRKNCSDYSTCAYVVQKKKFMKAEVGICNYHYMLSTCEFNPNIFIMDEAHNLPGILCDIASIKLSEFSFNRMAKLINSVATQFTIEASDFIDPLRVLLKDDPIKIEKETLRPYCESTLKDFKEYKADLEKELEVFNDERDDLVEQGSAVPYQLDKTIARISEVLDSFHNFNERFENYLESEVQWVVSDVDRNKLSIVIKPLEVVEGMKQLEARCNRMVFMSATICGPVQYAKELGLETEKSQYNQTKCPFPVENRRIFTTNVGSLNYKNKHEMLPLFIHKIDYLIDYMTQGWKNPMNGIVHSVSYQNAEIIQQRSKHKEKIFIPKGQDMMNLNEIISSHKGGLVIVSPSILEGVDLVDDLSRFQIFLKVPYGDLKDRWIKTKLDLDEKWYARETVVKMVQGCGRSIRSAEDWAWTFILDSNFGRLSYFNRELFPEWFMEAIQPVNI